MVPRTPFSPETILFFQPARHQKPQRKLTALIREMLVDRFAIFYTYNYGHYSAGSVRVAVLINVLMLSIMLMWDESRNSAAPLLMAAAEATTRIIYFVIYMLVYTRLVRGTFFWFMPPDAALIRELLTAYR